MTHCEADGSAVSRAQQFTGLFSRTGCENRADRVDDVASGLDAEDRGNDGLSGVAVADRPASPRQRIGARRADDCATHTTARFQRGVCGVDDGVNRDGGDVALNNLDETW